MNGPLLAVLWLVPGLAFAPVARAAPPAIAQTEINYLFVAIESSACEFFRKGRNASARQVRNPGNGESNPNGRGLYRGGRDEEQLKRSAVPGQV
jgi:hypothetical protein